MTPGIVEYRGKCKPFMESREIRRGKNKGRVEVVIRLGTSAGVVPRKRLVNPNQIRRYPS